METKCPVDAKCAAEISAMLTPPSPLQLQVLPLFLFSFETLFTPSWWGFVYDFPHLILCT
jgi:hypothetical protein